MGGTQSYRGGFCFLLRMAMLAIGLAPMSGWGLQSPPAGPKDLVGSSKAKNTRAVPRTTDPGLETAQDSSDLTHQLNPTPEVEIARLRVMNEKISRQLEDLSRLNEISHLRPLDFILLGLILVTLLVVAIPALWDRFSPRPEIDVLRSFAAKLSGVGDSLSIANKNLAELRIAVDTIARQHRLVMEKLESQQEAPKAAFLPVPPAAPVDRIKDLCDLYNQCRPDPNRWAEFLNKYQPIHFVCTNASDRLADEDLTPIFQTTTDGTFLAIHLDGIGYVSVPFLSTPIDAYNHGPGALGQVFECLNFGRYPGYQSLTLIKPALLRSEGDYWRIDQKGKLQVQQSARSGLA